MADDLPDAERLPAAAAPPARRRRPAAAESLPYNKLSRSHRTQPLPSGPTRKPRAAKPHSTRPRKRPASSTPSPTGRRRGRAGGSQKNYKLTSSEKFLLKSAKRLQRRKQFIDLRPYRPTLSDNNDGETSTSSCTTDEYDSDQYGTYHHHHHRQQQQKTKSKYRNKKSVVADNQWSSLSDSSDTSESDEDDNYACEPPDPHDACVNTTLANVFVPEEYMTAALQETFPTGAAAFRTAVLAFTESYVIAANCADLDAYAIGEELFKLFLQTSSVGKVLDNGKLPKTEWVRAVVYDTLLYHIQQKLKIVPAFNRALVNINRQSLTAWREPKVSTTAKAADADAATDGREDSPTNESGATKTTLVEDDRFTERGSTFSVLDELPASINVDPYERFHECVRRLLRNTNVVDALNEFFRIRANVGDISTAPMLSDDRTAIIMDGIVYTVFGAAVEIVDVWLFAGSLKVAMKRQFGDERADIDLISCDENPLFKRFGALTPYPCRAAKGSERFDGNPRAAACDLNIECVTNLLENTISCPDLLARSISLTNSVIPVTSPQLFYVYNTGKCALIMEAAIVTPFGNDPTQPTTYDVAVILPRVSGYSGSAYGRCIDYIAAPTQSRGTHLPVFSARGRTAFACDSSVCNDNVACHGPAADPIVTKRVCMYVVTVCIKATLRALQLLKELACLRDRKLSPTALHSEVITLLGNIGQGAYDESIKQVYNSLVPQEFRS